jgi:hypothetical protein
MSILDLAEAMFPEGKEGALMFLKAYGDESYDSTLFSCGSFMGYPRDFYYLGNQWNDRLKRDNISYFRASDCESLSEEFSENKLSGLGKVKARERADSILADLSKIIQAEAIVGISLSVIKEDFTKLISENSKARRCFGKDLMIFSYKMLIKQTVARMELDWPEPEYSKLKIGFVFDEHGNWERAEKSYEYLKRQDEICAKRMLVVSHADDKEYPGLQMADLMAYEARHYAKEWLRGSAKERHTMKSLRATHHVYLMTILDRKGLLAELRNMA